MAGWHHIQFSTGLLSANFWYIINYIMVLGSVVSHISFSENQYFHYFLIHQECLATKTETSPYWSNSKQLGPGRMWLPTIPRHDRIPSRKLHLLPTGNWAWVYGGGGYGPLTRYVKWRVSHAPGMPGTFPRKRGLAIPTCITARALRTCRDACRDR